MKLDLSVPVTGSPTAAFRSLSSAHPSPAVQEAHTEPALPEPGPALGQNLRLVGVPSPPKTPEDYPA